MTKKFSVVTVAVALFLRGRAKHYTVNYRVMFEIQSRRAHSRQSWRDHGRCHMYVLHDNDSALWAPILTTFWIKGAVFLKFRTLPLGKRDAASTLESPKNWIKTSILGLRIISRKVVFGLRVFSRIRISGLRIFSRKVDLGLRIFS